MRALVTVAALASVFMAARPARAQAFSRLEPGQQAMTLETGLQAGVVASLGYAAGLRVGALGGRTLMPFIQATLPVARPDLGDYAARAGAQVRLLGTGWLDVSAQAAFEVEETENSIHRATALRSDVVLLAGHYARAWFAAGEAGYDHAWLTYIKSSDWYRSYIFADARDGWYRNTAGTLHAGLKGGARLGAVEVVLRAGVNKSETLADLDLPFYATLGANYRF